MKNTGNNSALVNRVYRANRARNAVQNTIITAVALGATVLVGVTGFIV